MSARRTRLSSNGFFSWLHGDQQDAVPGALLHRDLVAERLHELSRSAGVKPRNWIMRPLAADGRHLRGRCADEDRAEAVEVGLALVPVVRVLLADPVRALHVLDELEGPVPMMFFSYQCGSLARMSAL